MFNLVSGDFNKFLVGVYFECIDESLEWIDFYGMFSLSNPNLYHLLFFDFSWFIQLKYIKYELLKLSIQVMIMAIN